MAHYTTELRTYLETLAGRTSPGDLLDVPTIIARAQPKVFDFNYQLTDTAHKPVLERKILYHYYTREIAFETVGLWKLKLQTKMNEIMPYYDDLYKSAKLEFDPLNNFQYMETAQLTDMESETSTTNTDQSANTTENVNATFDGKTSNTADTTRKNTDAYSETPQGTLSNIEDMTYLTTGRIVNDTDTQTADGTSTQDSTSKTTSDMTQNLDTTGKRDKDKTSTNTITKKGYQGISASELLDKYRASILNIDMLVVEALGDLFFTLY